MTIPWFNCEDKQKMKSKHKKFVTFTFASDFQYTNKEGRMTIPWFNYKAMLKIKNMQKNVFTFSISPDVQQMDKKSTVKSDEILKTEIKSSTVDTIKIEEVKEPYGRKRSDKLYNNKRNREINETCEVQTVSTNEDIFEIDDTNEINKNTRVNSRFVKIPSTHISKIRTHLHPSSFRSTIEAGDAEYISRLKADTEQEQSSEFESNHQMNAVLEFKEVSPSVPKLLVEDLLDRYSSEENVVEEINYNLEIGYTDESSSITELKEQTVITSKTKKITYSTFSKIYNFLHRLSDSITIEAADIEYDSQLKAATEPEEVSLLELNLQAEDILGRDIFEKNNYNLTTDDTYESNPTIDHDEHTEIAKKTMKITYSTFLKIYNFLRRPIESSTIDAEHISLLSAATKPEEVSRYELNLQAEEIFGRENSVENDVDEINFNLENEDTYESNFTNELDINTEIISKTIKIPYSTFLKIYNLLHRHMESSAFEAEDTEYDSQLKAATEQEEPSSPVLNLQAEELLARDTSEENVMEENNANLEAEDTYESNTITDLNVQKVITSKTIKIPYTTFLKIYNFLHRPIESSTIEAEDTEHDSQLRAATEQEGLPQPELILQAEENNYNLKIDDTFESNFTIDLDKHIEITKKTIKIPYSTFLKIYNFFHHLIESSTIEAENTEHDSQLKASTEPEEVSHHELNLQAGEILGRDTSEENIVEENNDNLEAEDTYESNSITDLDVQKVITSKTIKIPYSTFLKIYNFFHRPCESSTIEAEDTEHDYQLKASAEPEEVSQPELNLQVGEILGRDTSEENVVEENNDNLNANDTYESNSITDLDVLKVITSKTIKIPYSTFLKIYIFLRRPIESSTIEAENTEHDSQLKAATEREVVSLPELNLQAEEILGRDISKENVVEENNYNLKNDDTYESNSTIDFDKQLEINKKTIKIPYSTFLKIYNFLHRPIEGSTIEAEVIEHDFQMKAATEQEEASSPELNLQAEEILGRDISEENVVEENNYNLKFEDTYESNSITNLDVQKVITPKTIKIPYSTFFKIYNFLHRPIESSTIEAEDTEHDFQWKLAIELEEESNLQAEELISKDTSEENVVEENNYNLEAEDSYESNSITDLDVQKVITSETIKIPYTMFLKIHNFLHRPIESGTIEAEVIEHDSQLKAATEREEVSQPELNLQAEEVLSRDISEENVVEENNYNLKIDDTYESNSTIDLDKHIEITKKTIKIPYSTFLKIYNFLYHSIGSITIEVEDTEHNPQLKASTEPEEVSHPELNLQADVVEENNDNLEAEDTYESNSITDLDVHKVITPKTIKIPYSTFLKVYNFLHLRSESNTIEAEVTKHVSLCRLAIELEEEANLQAEELLAKDTSEEDVVEENNDNLEAEDTYESNSITDLDVQKVITSKTIKIPYSTFLKIYNFLYRSIGSSTIEVEDTEHDSLLKASTEPEEVSHPELNLQADVVEENNDNIRIDDTYESNSTIDLDEHIEITKKTIKIPYSTFFKIYNFFHRPIESSTIEAEDTEHDFQLKVATEQEGASSPGLNLRAEEILGRDISNEYVVEENNDNIKIDDTYESNSTIDLDKHIEITKKTIKIPYPIFLKIYNFLHLSSESNTTEAEVTKPDFQLKVAIEQEVVVNLQAEELLANDTSEENVVEENNDNLEAEDTYESNSITDLDVQKVITSKTIKIPYSTFFKIYNFFHRPIESSTIEAEDTEHDFQLKVATEQEEASSPGLNLRAEEILGRDISNEYVVEENNDNIKIDDTYESNSTIDLNEHIEITKKTIKIPYSTFLKIYNFLHLSSESNTTEAEVTKHDSQLKVAIEQEVVVNLQAEELLANDTSEENVVEEINHNLKTDDTYVNNSINEFNKYTVINSKTVKIPFSTFAEIDNFLRPPIFGSTAQNSYKFINPSNKKIPQMDTKLFDTLTYYHDQPYCQLVGFKSHEIVYTDELDNVYHQNMKKRKNSYQSIAAPLHDSYLLMTRETTNHSSPSVSIKVPVVVGEYNIEICMEEDVIFEEKVYRVSEISKKVVLTNCKFVPDYFSFSKIDGTRKAYKGKLFIEGFIHQNIEYTSFPNNDEKSMTKELENFVHLLRQKIVLELIVQLLQVQKVTMDTNQQANVNTFALKQYDENDKSITNLLKNLAPGTAIEQIIVNGAIIEVNSFIENNLLTNISTFLLRNNNILSIDTNQIDSLTLG